MKFCSFGSGSSGNCYYVGNGAKGILIDAGLSVKTVANHLKNCGIAMTSIMGILVTHSHCDHIKALKSFTNKYRIPVFTSMEVWNNILKIGAQKDISVDCIRKIPLQQSFPLSGFEIEAFPVSHDTPETLGYQISYKDKKLTVATDLGYICETAASYIRTANYLVIEFNYDEQMLKDGAYPQFLKTRIASEKGHLSNLHTATFLAENRYEHLSHIFLAHLSTENNSPAKALETLRNTFKINGKEINGTPAVRVLNRATPTELILLNRD